MLKLFDSLTKEKTEFKPIKEGHIGIYLCGNTVYDYCHIGHGRGMILFDVFTRYLRARGWKVTYVHNITDIDDKIITRANKNGETCDELTARFIHAQHEDERALHILPPDHEPQATAYIPQIITLVEKIIERGHAYVADNGDVYFDVRSFKDYGKLSHHDIDELRSGVRIEVGDAKKDPLDFVLWKAAKPGEPSWESPWGAGRPGWHIECSAMSTSMLGQPFDIHGGGLDLKFPHHENEIAQSESACEDGFANYWMHIGLIQINKEKMSKSLGNFVTLREVLETHHPEVIRLFMMSGHYRSPVNYAEETLLQMRQGLERLYGAIDGLPDAEGDVSAYEDRFNEAMYDDFNTPVALAVLYDMAREVNRHKESGDRDSAAVIATGIKKLGNMLGLLSEPADVFVQGDTSDLDVAHVEKLLAERQQARNEKNWPLADELRDELVAMKIIILDSKDGVTWRKG
ncbi:MAG: cysteine--tRNA ligase [Coxiella sp. (in: Bacteria)]|nr:MAG: cysteine--tRNA ligase [Coxiella sp. (in: g-proteobacteria)]